MILKYTLIIETLTELIKLYVQRNHTHRNHFLVIVCEYITLLIIGEIIFKNIF